MAEFCRVAGVAFRSTSLLRSSSKWSMISSTAPSMRQISTTPILWSITGRSEARGSTAKPFTSHFQNQNRSDWTTREPRPTQLEEEIKKPNISAYDDFFAPDFEFETGELNKINAKEDHPAPERPSLRLVPRTGRTVHVNKSVDVARSFKILSLQVAQNQIRRDFRLQRYHERPGLKRKRLNSERWQKRFKKGFKACVSRVKELTKQGW
ncbi:hypothetical protein F4818DRAFT_48320 [Hypoxylon cercidicola]|nr:hypothetical protein F4818DRAFT_48320 [Hypoxylon cercidicola]